ncbi:unnamed protein product [Closterium sp. NIES-65]|nr:unnamed protein product [Closterium sp. NIES-65]
MLSRRIIFGLTLPLSTPFHASPPPSFGILILTTMSGNNALKADEYGNNFNVRKWVSFDAPGGASKSLRRLRDHNALKADEYGNNFNVRKWAESLVAAGKAEEMKDPRLDAPADLILRLTQLALRCSGMPTVSRPDMIQVVSELTALRKEFLGKVSSRMAERIDEENSLDSFRAKVKPLVIARPATADEAPGERHPLEIWEINYDEIFPNSARLAKQFAEKSLKLSSPPVPSAASPAASSVVPSAACASAARTAPQQLTPRDRVSEALPSLSPDVDNSSPLSELASPQSPPSITIPARALDDFTSPPSFPQLRARMLGCKLGTPCIVSLARTPGDPGAWDADDEEYESEESTRRRFRRSGSTGGSRHWVGEKVGAGAEGGNYKERARGPSPLSGRDVAGSCGSPQRQQHGTGRVLVKRCSDPVMRSPREVPNHGSRLQQVRDAEPESRHRLARTSSKGSETSVRSSSAGRRRRSCGRFSESASVGSQKVRMTVRFYSDLLDPCVIGALAAPCATAASSARREHKSPIRGTQSGGEGEGKRRVGGNSGGSSGRAAGGSVQSPLCGRGSRGGVVRGGLAAAATAAAAATGPCRVVSLC